MTRRSTSLLTTLPFALALALSPLAPPAQAEAQTRVVEVVTPRPRPIHLIAGIGAEGGGFVDQASGLMGGAQMHFGVHLFGFEMYGLTQGFIGSLTVGSHQGSMEGLLWNSAMFGFGVGVFHLAAGPSLDFAWGCSDTNGDAGCYHGAPLYGINGRLALQFGSFEVSANVHPTFYGRSTVTGITVGLGWAF
jgi:hypothetical protein